MKTWFATYYPAPYSDLLDATVLATEKNITIGYRLVTGFGHTINWEMNDLSATYENRLQETVIINVKVQGCKLIIPGHQANDFILQSRAELSKPWHQKANTREGIRHFLIFSCISGLLITAYFLFVPWLSEKLAATISTKTEEEFGQAVFNALNITNEEDKESGILLNEFFSEMNVQTDYNVTFTVVKSDIVNAFALPGGNIVVYSALLSKLETYPELAALMSHEFAHVKNRHSTKTVFRQFSSGIFLALLFGKFGSVASVLADHADRFKTLRYSRELEKEADLEGMKILKERKIDPEGFGLLFQKLKAEGPASVVPEFLASHPDIENRINYIRQSSTNKSVEENTVLKAIFDKIKMN